MDKRLSYLAMIGVILAFFSTSGYAQEDTATTYAQGSSLDTLSISLGQINARANALKDEVTIISDKMDMIQTIIIATLISAVVLVIFQLLTAVSISKRLKDINSKIESSSKSINDTIRTENEKIKHRPVAPQFMPNMMPVMPEMPPHRKVEVKPEIHHPLKYPQKAEAVRERPRAGYKKNAIEALKKDLRER